MFNFFCSKYRSFFHWGNTKKIIENRCFGDLELWFYGVLVLVLFGFYKKTHLCVAI